MQGECDAVEMLDPLKLACAISILCVAGCIESQTGDPTGNDEGTPLDTSTGDTSTSSTSATTSNPTTSTTSGPDETSTNAETTTIAETSESSSGAETSEGSSSESGTTGEVAVCDPHRTDDACWACTRDSCCDALEACYDDPDCTCYVDCVSAGTEPVTCFTETCMLMMMPPGLADLQGCQYKTCGDPCPP